jgi:hypothetical protein
MLDELLHASGYSITMRDQGDLGLHCHLTTARPHRQGLPHPSNYRRRDCNKSQDRNEGEDYFIYTGEGSDDIPQDEIRVQVDPSIKVIRGKAFYWCTQLTIVHLDEGLKEIGKRAFEE